MLAVAVAVAVVVGTSGCSGVPQAGQEVGLGNAAVAIAASFQDSELDSTHGGQLILVDSGGGTRVVPTSGMNHMQLAWTGNALAFSDQENDYLLGDALESRRRSTSQESQVAIEALPSGGVRAVFNTGYEGDRYEVTSTTYDRTSSSSSVIAGVAPMGVADCAGGRYLFGMPDGDSKEEELRFEALDRAAPRSSAGFRLPFEPGMGADVLPCVDEVVYAIVIDSGVGGDDESAPTQVFLASMDLGASKFRLTPLTDSSGKRLLLGFDEVARGTMRPDAVGKSIEWVTGTHGRVFRTDMATGVTSLVREGMPGVIWDDAFYSFAGERLDVLSGATSGDVKLTTYDVGNEWRQSGEMKLPSVAALVGDQLVHSVLVLPGRST